MVVFYLFEIFAISSWGSIYCAKDVSTSIFSVFNIFWWNNSRILSNGSIRILYSWGGLIEWLLNIKTNGTNNEKKIELALIVGGGLGLLGTIVITYYVLRIAGADYFNNSLQPYNIWIAFSSLGFIVLLNKISLKITNYNVKKFFNWFSDKTLGVYVIQIFVRDAVIQCLREWLNNGAVYRYFVVFICTLVLSTATRCQVQVNIL